MSPSTAPPRRPVTGAMLAGGRSRRFGRDKSTVELGGITFAQRITTALAAVCEEVFVVGGDPADHPALDIPFHGDLTPGRVGPLAGLQAALHHATHPWCLLTACDTPAMDSAFIAWLVDRALEAPPEADVVVPVTREGRPQPLLAVYRRRCASTVDALLADGRLAMGGLLGELRAHPLTAEVAAGSGHDLDRLAWNINRPEDLAAAAPTEGE